MVNEITIINPDTMAATVQSLPGITSWIQRNHDKGLEKGRMLLDTAEANGTITKELYDEIGAYIEVAKKCKALMMDKRSPITQMMDSYRKVFTSLEADFDINNRDSIPGKLQQIRNKFAAEAKAKQEAEARKAQAEGLIQQAVEKYKAGVKQEYVAQVVFFETKAIERIKNSYANMTLGNHETVLEYISKFKEILSLDDTVGNLILDSKVARPFEIPMDYNLTEVRMNVYLASYDAVSKGYTERVRRIKQEYLDMIPSKVAQLKLAETNAEEAAKKAEELKQHEMEAAMKMQKEREEAEAKAKQEAEIKAQQAQAMGLFGMMEQTTQAADVKTKTKKVLVIDSKNAFLSILNFWWINEGQNMDIEELKKALKKQITFAEKRANAKEPEIVQGEGISFVEEITAK